MDAGGNRFPVIQRAKEINWLNTGTDVAHLGLQMAVKDLEVPGSKVKQGELWAKVYIIVKEQR